MLVAFVYGLRLRLSRLRRACASGPWGTLRRLPGIRGGASNHLADGCSEKARSVGLSMQQMGYTKARFKRESKL